MFLRIQENSNPDAKIGFVIYYPFQFYVYKNMYRELAADAEFIVDLCHPFPAKQQQVLLGDIVALLEKNQVAYRILYHEDYYFPRYLERFFSKYKGLVSVWEKGCIQLRCTADLKKINPTYGAGKELTMARPSRSIFDLVLSYGPRDTALFSYYTRAEMVGNPKFDDWFSDSVDQESISELRKRLGGSKKTILYLPTHGDLSSIDELAGEFAKLAGLYNVLVKTHYYTTREEPDRVEKLRRTGALFFDDSADLLVLLKVCDVVVSDNSSAIFDAILADKPVVVADFWDEDFLDLQHKELRQYTRGPQGAITYSGSIEQVIKREGKVLTLKNGGELAAKLQEALQDSARFKKVRAKLRKELFAFNDGACAKRAARAIRGSLTDPKPTSRPILYHVFEAYKRRIGLLSYSRERRLNRTITEYKQFLDEKIGQEERGIVFSVILTGRITDDNNSLRALFEQEYPSKNYEIIAVDIPDKVLQDHISPLTLSKNELPLARGVSSEGNFGKKIEGAMRMACGRVVCFTNTSCRVPTDWLPSLHLAYKKYPNAGGVGGYVKVDKECRTIFDTVLDYDLGKRLGIENERRLTSKLYEVENRLFYQNPVGDLANMSYLKELIPPYLTRMRSLLELELHLKINTMTMRPLCFIPKAVTRLIRMTALDFVRIHYEQGRLNRLERRSITRLGRYQRQALVSVLAYAVRATRRYKNMSSGALALVAGTARWMGDMSAASLLLRRRAVLVFSDRTQVWVDK